MTVVLVRCLRRVPRLTRDEFREDLRQRSRRALDWSAARRVTLFLTADDDTDHVAGTSYASVAAPDDSYDGITLQWFDDEESLRAEIDHPRFASHLRREEWFVDHERSFVRLGAALTIIEPDPVDAVLVQCLRRKQGLATERFHEIWDEHAQYGHQLHGLGYLSGYYQIRWADRSTPEELAPLGREQVDWDGLVLTYVESRAALKAMLAAPLMPGSTEHATTFLEPDGYHAMTTNREALRVPNV
jgi:hypothetical protein